MLAKLKNNIIPIIGISFLVIGIFLRFFLLLQNRNLIIDEANIIFNIVAKDYLDLINPLDYQQYAPILFLWLHKLVGYQLGFGEVAMRAPACLASVFALVLFYKTIKSVLANVWVYPLYFLAIPFFFINYASTIKQYSFDLLFSCAILFLISQIIYLGQNNYKKILQFGRIASIAIWSSMPIIFIITSAICVLFWHNYRDKANLKLVIFVSMLLGVQFLINYFYLLAPNLHQPNLESFHGRYFLDLYKWSQNCNNILSLITTPMGYTALAIIFHSLLITLGFRKLYLGHQKILTFLILPILFTLGAALFHKYSLIDRLLLFLYPFIITLMGFGLAFLFDTINNKYLRIVVVIICCINMINSSYYKNWTQTYYFHQITEGLKILKDKEIPGDKILVHHLTWPTYKYYTTLHKSKTVWQHQLNSHLYTETLNFTNYVLAPNDTNYILIAGGLDAKASQSLREKINKNFKGDWLLNKPYAKLFWFAN
jgi:hypothetical protein